MHHEAELNENVGGRPHRLLSYEEVDEIIAKAFSVSGVTCQTLCREYRSAAEVLQDAPPKFRAGLMARLKVLHWPA